MKIHITGGAGFIGSNLVKILNEVGITPIVYDRLTEENWKNLSGLSFILSKWGQQSIGEDDVLVHLAANVDTTEPFNDRLWNNNVVWPLEIFPKFSKVIYASSGAVYGAEEKDFSERIYGLKQLNAYGFSKWSLDEAIFGKSSKMERNVFESDNIFSLRFFNVYGPNEVHKGNMQSVVSKAINKLEPLYQGTVCSKDIKGRMEDARKGIKTPFISKYSLFRSDRPEVKDGEQMRDFIFVYDVANVILFFIRNKAEAGIYNLGSGKASSFKDLIQAVDPKCFIEYVDMSDTLKKSYQYFTQADITKLRRAGYTAPMTSLQEGIEQTIALTFPKR